MNTIEFTRSQVSDLKFSSRREIILANKKGCYSSSSLGLVNTRKYHGLLVAPQPQLDGKRYVLLSGLDEMINYGEKNYKLGAHYYPNAVSPEGYSFMDSFTYQKNPAWTYKMPAPTPELDDITLKKELLLVRDEERVLLKYTVMEASQPMELWFEPFLAFRNIHELTKANLYPANKYEKVPNGIKLRLYAGFSNLYIQFSRKNEYVPSPDWYYNMEYPVEQERGYGFREDLYRPGYFCLLLRKGEVLFVSAGLSEINPAKISVLFNKETKTNNTLDNPLTYLENAAAQFIVSGEKTTSLMAGYHWFEEWGRDTFIALPGLTVAMGKPDVFLKVIDSAVKNLEKGLFPNMGIGEKASFNSADAPLWFFWALQQYALTDAMPVKTGAPVRLSPSERNGHRLTVWKEYGSYLKSILENYLNGTLFNIHALDNGLLFAGENGVAVTWMDAVVNGKPVTPRTGLAVEINALWYNAVCFALECAEREMDSEFYKNWQDYPAKIEKSFRETFQDENYGYLADCVNGDAKDWSLRPNQVIAASLPYSPIDSEMKKRMLEIVKGKLLTSRGLRTLSPDDKHYRGVHEGGPAMRDSAYHQGTVWPWLFGHYAEASLNTYGSDAIPHIQSLLEGFNESLTEYGLGTVAEIYDGNEPHHPRGAISQAWSVAELLRISRMLKFKRTLGVMARSKRNETAIV